MTDDHIFIHDGLGGIHSTGGAFIPVKCRYCTFSTWKNNIGEYLNYNNIKCLSREEKIIKDIIE